MKDFDNINNIFVEIEKSLIPLEKITFKIIIADLYTVSRLQYSQISQDKIRALDMLRHDAKKKYFEKVLIHLTVSTLQYSWFQSSKYKNIQCSHAHIWLKSFDVFRSHNCSTFRDMYTVKFSIIHSTVSRLQYSSFLQNWQINQSELIQKIFS
ncbi:unnamed protein product [Caenorhabditis angaria]|uniref:Uncharacterized protein n=1 Tax=Caenorhabditis angaria TaxID=860376 RepID=A0A9P1NA20_9PELO|nr:unnamed protein product [Caenorhabditis angaria]